MNTPRPKTVTAAAGDLPAPEDPLPAEPPIWDTLGDEDRTSIERGLAQSLAGIPSTDEEVEAAFAAFRR